MLSETALTAARIVDGSLAVGPCRYSTVLVPPTDRLQESASVALANASAAGVSVYWFGGGPARQLTASGQSQDADLAVGAILQQRAPTGTWCRAHLPGQTQLAGRGSRHCMVRRFRAVEGTEHLFAVNLQDQELHLRLPADQGRVWKPEHADGEVHVTRSGTRWHVPPRCCALFVLGDAPTSRAARRAAIYRGTGTDRRFMRLAPNTLRLNRPTVIRPGTQLQALDYPQPYWKLFKDYTAIGQHHAFTFAGEVMPVESCVPEGDLRYCFAFAVEGQLKTPFLVLDPRCARGAFRVFLNGCPLGGWRTWPLAQIVPTRLRLSRLRNGPNELELRFRVSNAMEGLLSQLTIEGDFGVDVSAELPVLRPPTTEVSPDGWQASGLPHYMGACWYSWNAGFTAADLTRPCSIRFDRIVDSAELVVNGRSCGSRAWAPWEWQLAGLQARGNRFELIVHGTAGNKHELDWPDQPQGWIGKAVLLS